MVQKKSAHFLANSNSIKAAKILQTFHHSKTAQFCCFVVIVVVTICY